MCQGLRNVTVQMHGVIRHEETNEQVPETGRFLMVAKGSLDTLPERLCQVEFFNLVPARWRCTQVDLVYILDIGTGVEQGAQDGKKFRLLSLDYHGQHLAVQVNSRVVGGHERLQLLQTFLIVKKRAALAEMVTQVVVLQPQLIEDDGGPVGTETAAIQTDIEQPVVCVIRFCGRGIQQEPTVGLVTL